VITRILASLVLKVIALGLAGVGLLGFFVAAHWLHGQIGYWAILVGTALYMASVMLGHAILKRIGELPEIQPVRVGELPLSFLDEPVHTLAFVVFLNVPLIVIGAITFWQAM